MCVLIFLTHTKLKIQENYVMKKNTVVIAAVAAVFVFLLLAIGTLSFTLISNNNKNAAAEQEEKINQKVDELVEEKIQEKEKDDKKAEEKKQAEEKAAKNKANFITAKEARDNYTERGVAVKPLECEITAKEKKIPSNVDQKAEGGMISCKGEKYRVYIGDNETYNYFQKGDFATFEVRWIESNLYYFYLNAIGEWN